MSRSTLEQFVADLEELAQLGFDDEVTEEDDVLGSLCEEYLELVNHGETVDKVGFLAKCPESLRHEARTLLNTIDLLRKGVGSKSPVQLEFAHSREQSARR